MIEVEGDLGGTPVYSIGNVYGVDWKTMMFMLVAVFALLCRLSISSEHKPAIGTNEPAPSSFRNSGFLLPRCEMRRRTRATGILLGLKSESLASDVGSDEIQTGQAGRRVSAKAFNRSSCFRIMIKSPVGRKVRIKGRRELLA
jgi:hypothetical protein